MGARRGCALAVRAAAEQRIYARTHLQDGARLAARLKPRAVRVWRATPFRHPVAFPRGESDAEAERGEETFLLRGRRGASLGSPPPGLFTAHTSVHGVHSGNDAVAVW